MYESEFSEKQILLYEELINDGFNPQVAVEIVLTNFKGV